MSTISNAIQKIYILCHYIKTTKENRQLYNKDIVIDNVTHN